MYTKVVVPSVSPENSHHYDMRVADFLQELGEMGNKSRRSRRRNPGAPPPHYEPQTPRSFLSRLLLKTAPAAGNISGGAAEGSKLGCLVPFSNSCCKNDKETEEEEEEGFSPNEVKETIPAMAESVEGDGEKKAEALSFNLGMGAGLVFLLAKSANEFNKMVELRTEMEMMIECIKGEMQRKASASNLQESKVHSFPNSNYMGSNCSNRPHYLHDDAESCNFTGVCHGQPNLNTDFDAKMCSKGHEIEQELQVELQRLQLNLEDQDSSMHPHGDRLEINSESNESLNDTNQQVNEPNKAEDNRQTGVCPRELERRLHELLEARQQERIVELETALECAERKLNEKELEICWWRDTARLVSKHREERYQLQF